MLGLRNPVLCSALYTVLLFQPGGRKCGDQLILSEIDLFGSLHSIFSSAGESREHYLIPSPDEQLRISRYLRPPVIVSVGADGLGLIGQERAALGQRLL